MTHYPCYNGKSPIMYNVNMSMTNTANINRPLPIEVPATADVCAIVPEYTGLERQKKLARIRQLLEQNDAALVAHYYVQEDIQMLAEDSGGFVGDSLEMARFGQQHPASTLVVAGVRFMGETAKILSPQKRVLMPTLEATCSLDESCPPEMFADFCDAHPGRVVVVYANTSAAVKARADWVVTSSIALEVVCHLMDQGKKILWAPDKYLGKYVRRVSGADMLIWQGSCVVHEEFKYLNLVELKREYPDAAVLVHPEAPEAVIDEADVVGSTSMLINAVKTLNNKRFIVATDNRIFYKMRQIAPNKTFIEAPTAGEGATCSSCAHCPWMAMNGLDNLEQTLLSNDCEVLIDENIRRKAFDSTMKMIEFSAARSSAPARDI